MSKTRKTTMSVPEMRQLLGIGKTDSYWLVHKQCFETILVEGKMRVVIDSFEHWYANQIKYKKVDGTPPGEELRSNSYSPPEIAEMLGLYMMTINLRKKTCCVGHMVGLASDQIKQHYYRCY